MSNSAKKSFSLSCWIAGACLLIYALVLCFQAMPLRARDIGGILSFRGLFLFASFVIIAAGFYAYPTYKHRAIINVLFMLPILIPFVMTIILPFFFGVFYSFTNWNGNKFTEFVGFANYKTFFSAPDYINSVVMTFLFALVNVFIINMLAFLLALLVTQKIRGNNVYRAGFFVPNLIGGIVLGYAWQFIFNYVFPLIGMLLGFENSQSMLIQPLSALVALIIVSTWQYAGYIMMIYVTALNGIPSSVIEAAKIDGANGFKRMTSIVMPMVAHAFTICIFLTLVNSFKQFDLNFSLTNGGPSKLFMGKAIMSTELQALNIYKTAITRNEWALGQAKSVVFFVILAAISLLQVSINKKYEEEA